MRWLGIAAVMLALGVVLGAFGAHGLKDKISADMMAVYEKAVLYHLVHALGMLIVAALISSGVLPSEGGAKVCVSLLVGIVLFSGSLYLLSTTGVRWLGAVAPLGGTAFIIAWGLLAFQAFRMN